MSITLRATVGRHRSSIIIAGLRGQVRELKADKLQLAANAYRADDEIHTALIRGCQDAMLIAQLRAENTAVKKANEEWRRTVIRAKAEQERLRRAVVNARPKISVAVQPLDRPYISHVQFPYPVPVGQSTANDETQQLPVIEQPKAAWPVYEMRAEGVAS
ncbi:hypothetical protein OG601_46970 [Streptomyces sp. NBC_01239]|uniref:hypothetical protein n=1 Tax=Streptomyces sp. NBC_01239 TaxID=2903792 RepID=UPI00224D69C8|nr:hypothetical protein [Streptomyces sp. NBC_01239]MCX4809066.1 hypothetical protein [Streptomyces sp. NBC_01239]MCX4818117.1 hypothetical protein [Streptomyces sp. NBC_01239]